MINLLPVDVNNLLRGSSLLACGGGLKYSEQKKLVVGKTIQLINPEELKPNSWCATVSEVGAANAPVMVKTKLPQALKLLESKTNKSISALIPPEIGQEAIVIDSAAITGLPVVNSDLAGCRAVPKLDNQALLAQGVKFTMSPAVVLTASGKTYFIPKNPSLAQDEQAVRQLVPQGQIVTLIGGIISKTIIAKYLNYRSYSLAMALGSSFKFPTPILFGPITIKVKAIQTISSPGFDSKIVTIVINGQSGKLTVENEYLNLQFGEKEFSFPQLIMIYNRKFGRGIHSSEIKINQSYTLVVADAFNFKKEII